MYKVLNIGGQDVPMLATASNFEFYKKVFGEDYLRKSNGKDSDDVDATNAAIKMGFIMAKYSEFDADRKKMLKLNEESYLEWLDGFSLMDLLNASGEITLLQLEQQKGSSVEKK